MGCSLVTNAPGQKTYHLASAEQAREQTPGLPALHHSSGSSAYRELGQITSLSCACFLNCKMGTMRRIR